MMQLEKRICRVLTPVASQPFDQFSFRSFAAMPRITVKGLTIENDMLERSNSLLREGNRELQAELNSRKDRSRSRRRKAAFKVEPVSARTMMALDIVCKRNRDHVIDEQKATIAKQAQEIERLKRGEGLVKPVLIAAFNFSENTSCNTTETMQAYVKRLWSENNNSSMGILFGNRNR
jgi:hypothetical protein